MQIDTTEPIQDQALDHIRGLRIIVQDGAPTKLKVKCSISKP